MEFPARYNDGKSAVSHPVMVGLEPPWLTITGQDLHETVLARWSLVEVRLVNRPAEGMAPRLANGESGDERLTLLDAAPFLELERLCPGLHRSRHGMSGSWGRLLGWGAAGVAALVVMLVLVIPWLAERAAQAMPPDLERRIGEQAVADLARILGMEGESSGGSVTCSGAGGRAALAGLGRRLAAGADLDTEIAITVLDLDMINAFALPGGQIVVMRGLIDFVREPNELAGVLAHEIGHVARHHPMSVFLKHAGTAALIGFMVGDVTGGGVMAGMATMLIHNAYTRDAEADADAIGTDLMNRAGYGGAGLAEFLLRVEEKEAGDALKEGLAFLSTHPISEERARAIRRQSRATGSALSPVQWQAVKRMCGAEQAR